MLGHHLLGVQVVQQRPVGGDGHSRVPGRDRHLVQPARRPAGDERDDQAGRFGRLERGPGPRGDGAVRMQQRAVEVAAQHPNRSVRTRLRHACGVGAVSSSRPPSQGRSAAGTYTLPSGCWWWSSRQAIVRATAQSVPFRVATGTVPRSVRVRMLSRRAWYVVQFDVDVSSRYAPWDGNQASMSNFARRAGAEVARGHVDHPVAQFERVHELAFPGQQPPVLVARVVDVDVGEHLDLVEPVDPDDAAGVLAVGAGLAPEAGREPGVTTGQRRGIQDLVRVEAGQRDLARADQVEVVVGQLVDLGRVRAQEAGALHDLGLDQGRGDDRRESPPVGVGHGQVDQREFQLRADAGQEVEPRTRDLGAALGVDRLQHGADLGVLPRVLDDGRCADEFQYGEIVLATGRRAVLDQVGDGQMGQPQGLVGVGLLDLGVTHPRGQFTSAGQQMRPCLRVRAADGLADLLLLGPQPVGLGHGRAPPVIGGEQGVNCPRVVTAVALRGPEQVGVGPDGAQIDHFCRLSSVLHRLRPHSRRQ